MNSKQDNPFAQDSLPIGTVVAWEGKKIMVIPYNNGACEGCHFYNGSCSVPEVNCISSDNTDRLERKYILINEQQEEETMSIKLEEEVKQEPEGHVHAELMLEYGKDALVSKTPWKGWQHASLLVEGWKDCTCNPAWGEELQYRRKPKTILINGYEVPEPIRNLPDLGKPGISETVWIPSLTEIPSFALGVGNSYTRVFFDRGLCHLTKEAAELHAKALLSFTTAVQE